VFTLLESIYQAFDRIAKRRQVFKIETIGGKTIILVAVTYPVYTQIITGICLFIYLTPCLYFILFAVSADSYVAVTGLVSR